MKKTITLAAALALAMGAYAQVESGKMDPSTFDFENFPQGTTLAETQSVKMFVGGVDTYKATDLGNDHANTVTINGTEYVAGKGITGSANPSINSLTFTNAAGAAGVTGCVYGFNVKADGVLYVIGKINGGKKYYVYEGDLTSSTPGSPVAYSMKVWSNTTPEEPVFFTLPGDDLNWFETGKGYDDGAGKLYSASWCYEVYTKEDGEVVTPTGDAAEYWIKEDGFGVIAFPVYAEAGTYYVNGDGTKMASCGYLFVPGATEVKDADIVLSKTESEAAIESVAADADDENAPVYNINGQEVSKDTKGLLIRKGKKYYNR